MLALIPVAINTKHWKEYIFGRGAVVCFLSDTRLKFMEGGVLSNKGVPMACAMVYWDYKGHEKYQEPFYGIQRDWNQTLMTMLNKVVAMEDSDSHQESQGVLVYEVSAGLEWLMKSLLYYFVDNRQPKGIVAKYNGIDVKYTHNYRNTIVYGNHCIKVLNYECASESLKFSILDLEDKIDGNYMDTLNKLIDIYPNADDMPKLSSFCNWVKYISEK